MYTARLNGAAALNRRLLPECRQLERDDESGRRWSAKNYPGGYTSYNSASRMYEVSPTFAQLKRGLDRHVASFAKSLEFDLKGRELQMTDCWVNIMPRQVVHSLHLHPLATISGTYYVHTPRGSAGLKLEDPRLDRYMAAPPLKVNARADRQRWVVIPAQAGRSSCSKAGCDMKSRRIPRRRRASASASITAGSEPSSSVFCVA